MDRAAVFIDGGYFGKVLEMDFARPKIDFCIFSENICGEYERLRTYYYTCMPFMSNPPSEDEKRRFSSMEKFVYTLKKLPRFEVRLGKLGWSGGELVQKRVDIMLASDLVRLSWAKQIGKAVIITGDRDFVPAIEAAKDAGVVVQLYYSPTAIHEELISSVDEGFIITQELIDNALRRFRPRIDNGPGTHNSGNDLNTSGSSDDEIGVEKTDEGSADGPEGPDKNEGNDEGDDPDELDGQDLYHSNSCKPDETGGF